MGGAATNALSRDDVPVTLRKAKLALCALVMKKAKQRDVTHPPLRLHDPQRAPRLDAESHGGAEDSAAATALAQSALAKSLASYSMHHFPVVCGDAECSAWLLQREG